MQQDPAESAALPGKGNPSRHLAEEGVLVTPPPQLPVVPEGACANFLRRGRCRFTNCRFSHDVDRLEFAAAVAAAKKAVLPAASRSAASSSTNAARQHEDTKHPSNMRAAAPSAILKSQDPQPVISQADLSTEALQPDEGPSDETGRRSSWRSVDFLLRGSSVASNSYLAQFAQAPWLPEILRAPECASLLSIRSRSLRKELSEAFGMLHACRRALGKLGIDVSLLEPLPHGAADTDQREMQVPKVTIVDLCCGKGFGSLVLALSLPCAQVLGVDINPDMELAHFQLCSNLSFQELDVTRSDAAELLAAAEAKAVGQPRVLVVVGMHLCGALSQHAMRLFKERSKAGPTALVLAPCCLDGRQPSIKRCAKSLKVDPHLFWCLSLLFDLPPPGQRCRCELFVDDDVLSAKNRFLVAAAIGAQCNPGSGTS